MHACIHHVLYTYRTFSTEEDDRITEAVNLYGSGQWKLGENNMCTVYSEISNPDDCRREDTYTVLRCPYFRELELLVEIVFRE